MILCFVCESTVRLFGSKTGFFLSEKVLITGKMQSIGNKWVRSSVGESTVLSGKSTVSSGKSTVSRRICVMCVCFFYPRLLSVL